MQTLVDTESGYAERGSAETEDRCSWFKDPKASASLAVSGSAAASIAPMAIAAACATGGIACLRRGFDGSTNQRTNMQTDGAFEG